MAYCSAGFGAYAQALNLPASRLVKIPDGIDFEQAAACLLKGQTTEYLLQRTYPLQAGETCLFHAAAGGVGLIFGQWASSIGATAIGTVGSQEKAELARAHGFAHVINYRTENVVQRVLEITGGAKVPVVYDGVGKDTFDISLDCLRPRGLMVSFGNASGAPDPLNLQTLANKGSLYITRPTMVTYTPPPRSCSSPPTICLRASSAGQCGSRSTSATPWRMCSRHTATWRGARPQGPRLSCRESFRVQYTSSTQRCPAFSSALRRAHCSLEPSMRLKTRSRVCRMSARPAT